MAAPVVKLASHCASAKLLWRVPQHAVRLGQVTNGNVTHLAQNQLDVRLVQARSYSQQPQRKGFIGQFIENIKLDMAKNKEMKENIKKFREEAEKLEKSDALQQARKKYETIEMETSRGTDALKRTVSDIKDKVQKGVEDVQKQEWAKKAGSITEDISKTAKGAAEKVSRQGEELTKTAAYRTISDSVKAVKQEIDESTTAKARPYRAPVKLRKRTDGFADGQESRRIFEANEDATGMVLHKDSRWYKQWSEFKENSHVFNKMFDLKMRYDESDNVVVRASRAVTDKVSQLLGGVFSPTEMSEVLTEILKVDPHFSKQEFLYLCEHEIIPNVLEAMIRGDLEVLKDWCYEAPYSQLATPIKQAKAMGYMFDNKILDIDNLDLSMGKMMEQGPVLVISFTAQQLMVVRNTKGELVEGDPDKVLRVTYVWVLCRDQEVLDPNAAWRLLDLSANTAQQWV
ncbi:mitochondrial import inner membrane translocase subunit TIM44-like [Acanthaster planci]|uniref:Mitochondrial import inner membrane translocase subunit TIM44 n=1 Tax=Acanthaster planci TaxID=133434 RepID=A0A8B7YSH7_ACAPL|nr:mitochondrial import inner membrane translocase subunit TIM44-like [Acanthaster planci]